MSGPLSDLFALKPEFSEDMAPASALDGTRDDTPSFHHSEGSDEVFAAPNAGGPDAPSGD
ncbi:hypothetical protein [Sphingomonas sp. S2-65]|uniref:hypothetical protein n=1 Tax=Sphingomonas sp. S2-65 TaxID=2903960 RepID=UPI001F379CEC|nr:hypothetical protein [Sphingomonas sp. S2-65]UYY59718.1 hypothetical protein LZ586_06435 [Sphingomonas sp. S2-65]